MTEDDTDPRYWGVNWPKEYDSYKRTALTTRTRFGGHGGSEAMPEEKIERDPWLKRMFLGYAFSIDYRDRRGHAYMLADQEATERLTKPQSGSCLHCHAAIMPLYRETRRRGRPEGLRGHLPDALPGGEPQAPRDRGTPTRSPAWTATTRRRWPSGSRGPGSSWASRRWPPPTAPSPTSRRSRLAAGDRGAPYDPNRDATRTEMRSYVCGQCHVEYYCSSKMPLTFPWGQGPRRRRDRGLLGRDQVRGRAPLLRLRARRDRGARC